MTDRIAEPGRRIMKRGLRIGEFELIWLNGGRFELDGGAMFGVVPKVLWKKKYKSDEDNYIPLAAWPILIKTPDSYILIESGLGNKLTEKQKQIFRVRGEWDIINDLRSLGMRREDIDFLILTHYDFDHSGGVVMNTNSGGLALTFPRARHIVQRKEWDDVLNPNTRSINTFWPINYEVLKESGNLELVEGEMEVVRGVKVVHTGGHNRGHQIVSIESDDDRALHLADLLPTHAHFNPLWLMAYDNYPLDTITQKEAWEKAGVHNGSWFTFYHDPFVLAARFDGKRNIIDKFPEIDG
jgi:glyoxylase-like metal-dependent hydrolase (beta-lactamase superfamily II)